MQNKFSILVFLLIVFNATFGQKELIEFKGFGYNPGNLGMFVHVPVNKKDSTKHPLIIALHGCSQYASTISKETGWNKLADRYGFYMLYPQQRSINNPSNCFNWFRENDITRGLGEVASIRRMIQFAVQKYPIDTNQIFVYGLSAGAAMAVALMADYPALIKAGAILAGAPYKTATNSANGLAAMINAKEKPAKEWAELVREQNPEYTCSYPKLVVVQGQSDPVVNRDNALELIKQWTYLHSADSVPDMIETSFQNQPDITKLTYFDKDSNDVVIFYKIDHLGHKLMIDPGEGEMQGGKTGLFAVDKDFFSTYWIMKDFGLGE